MIVSDPIRDFAIEVAERGSDTTSFVHAMAGALIVCNPRGEVIPESDVARLVRGPDSDHERELTQRLVDACRDALDGRLYTEDLWYCIGWLNHFQAYWPHPRELVVDLVMELPTRPVRRRS